MNSETQTNNIMTHSQFIESLPISFVVFAGIVLILGIAFAAWLVLADPTYKDFDKSFDNANSLFEDEKY